MSMQGNITRDGVIDAAKAFSIILVLIWHLRPFSVASGSSGRISDLARFGLDLFYRQISLIGVPLFILISLILLWRKLEVIGLPYAGRRIIRLSCLYAVWTICQFACLFLMFAYQSFPFGDKIFRLHIDASVPVLIMNGGPSLPVVGGSVFYYLFVLICLSLLLTFFYAIPVNAKGRYSLACVMTFLCLYFFQWLNWHGGGLFYWRLNNFLVYVPLAYIVSQHEQSWHAGTVAMLLICFILFAIQDVYIGSHIGNTGYYSRVSVVFGSVTFLAFFRIALSKMKKLPNVFAFFAIYSLGIFAIHKYWQLVIYLVAQQFDQVTCTFFLDMGDLFKAISCIILTCGTVYLIGRTSLNALVR